MIAVAIGTRPEIVKMSPIIKVCERQKLDYFILHTGQHYSYNLDKAFFEELGLPEPKYNLNAGSSTDVREVAGMMFSLEGVFMDEKPDIVLVEGDTHTVLATALAASKMGIKVGHIEAGLRSYDKNMQEEINRILTDHCSDLLFAPTENAKRILCGEGRMDAFVTGNTIVDVLNNYNRKRNSSKHILVTLHRQENVDSVKRFGDILKGLDLLCDVFRLPIIYPIHPRSKKMMDRFGLETITSIIEPVGYMKFLELMMSSYMVLTDSGGVQEECCVMGVPCVTLRDNTERPETIEVGANILAGTQPEKIVDCAKMMGNRNGWRQPFGDGRAGERIVDIIRRYYG